MIDDLAARYPGTRVLRTPVGEAHIVEAMRPAGAIIGGEGNGGVVLPGVCWVRDSFSAMALVLDLLAARPSRRVPLSAIIAALPRYTMIKHSFDLQELGGREALAPAIEKVTRAFADRSPITFDGVRIDFTDGWVHFRGSNTEPIVRLIAEATSRERAWELIDEVAVAAGIR
jgi:phosphomannomutase